jgi:DNA-binding response OmpR family regulator
MIVDDERSLLALAEEIIAQLGYEPVGFDSSAAALAAFRNKPQRYDAVLTDESMPDLIGTALAHEIRQIRASIPIILMSGYGGAQLTNRAAEIGINEVLRKTLHRRDLEQSAIPIVMLTGVRDEADWVMGLELGAGRADADDVRGRIYRIVYRGGSGTEGSSEKITSCPSASAPAGPRFRSASQKAPPGSCDSKSPSGANFT